MADAFIPYRVLAGGRVKNPQNFQFRRDDLREDNATLAIGM